MTKAENTNGKQFTTNTNTSYSFISESDLMHMSLSWKLSCFSIHYRVHTLNLGGVPTLCEMQHNPV